MEFVPAHESHARLWHSWRQDRSAIEFNPFEVQDHVQLASRLRSCSSDLSNRAYKEYRWFVVVKEKTVGTIALSRVDWLKSEAYLSYHIAAAASGQGLATEAAAAICERGFASDLQRIRATVACGHLASIRVIEKLNFSYAETLTRHFELPQGKVDVLVYERMR